MNDVILIIGGGMVGFVLGMIAMLLLWPRALPERVFRTGEAPALLDDLTRPERRVESEDTQKHPRIPARFLNNSSGGSSDNRQTAPLHVTTRSSAPVAMLTAQGGELKQRSWLLRYAASTTVGRFDDCDIAIDDHGVSRLHAQITHRTDAATAHEFAIFDYSSTNGTMVNGQPINAVASLQDGDVITIGTTEFVFRRVRQD